MKGYCCVKCFFVGTNLTASVNVLIQSSSDGTYKLALDYFEKTFKRFPVRKLVWYETESDMHSEKNSKGVWVIRE